MILEVAVLDVKPGQEPAFEADFCTASSLIASISGYAGHELRRCIEKENRYILLVTWQKLEDHTKGFRQSGAYQEWKRLLHPYYDPFPIVEHYKMVMQFPPISPT